MIETIYFAGGCLWGVQAFIKTLKGVIHTQFDSEIVTISQLMDYFFDIIDPYSVNKQGNDEGKNIAQAYIVKCPNIWKKRRII